MGLGNLHFLKKNHLFKKQKQIIRKNEIENK